MHAVQHEVEHKIKHDDHHSGGDPKDFLESRNKRVALLIAVIALFLAFSETLGKSAQTAGISYNVEASNLWAFFQAKTIRITTLRTAVDTRKIDIEATPEGPVKAAMAKQIDGWTRTAARYEDEADPPEGRKQLMARAKEAESKRDIALAKYHHYEIASAAFQIGIVLASATVITGMIALSYIAVALAIGGLGFMGIALLAPHAVHLF
ncbi:MAG: DUF4337 domain-containing protein [Rhodospirillales bacterium]|nr:DUF4337 domain-containing protein [Rhodospirillales bacterium]